MNPQDVVIKIQRTGVDCPVDLEVTHRVTGHSVKKSGYGELRLRQEALRELRKLVDESASA